MNIVSVNPIVSPDGFIDGSTMPVKGIVFPASHKHRDHATKVRAWSYYTRRKARIAAAIKILVAEQWEMPK